MIRMFEQHKIRFQKELEGYWEFMPAATEELPLRYDYKMYVPGCWENDIRFNGYRGIGVFRRKIFLDENTNLRLNFKGVSHTAHVYFDGEKIKKHYNAYTEFSKIVQNVKKGEHELTVVVDNRFTEESALHVPNDYYCYGGLTRPVIIEKVPEVFIKHIHFTPYQHENAWKAKIDVFIENITDNAVNIKAKIRFDMKDCGVPEYETFAEVNPGEEKVISAVINFENVQAWSPSNPKLYLVEANLFIDGDENPADDLIERVGFRSIQVEGYDIKLNGEKIFLKGFNRHEDHPAAGCAIPTQLMTTDLYLMEDMGANTVRTCHYPNDERFLDMCDERGMLVWEENHARGFSLEQMKHPYFEQQCKDCIDEMITSHYNHPSIVIWGILNECASDTEEGRLMYEKQFRQIKSMDASRPLTFASCKHFKDICLDMVDIVSDNLYFGWYNESRRKDEIEKDYQEELSWINSTAGRGKPIIISEFGAGGIYGTHSPYAPKWSEERQNEILDNQLSIYLNRPEIVGALIWQFCDCRVTEEKWSLRRPRTMNNKGVVDEYRRPKLAYTTVKKHFGE